MDKHKLISITKSLLKEGHTTEIVAHGISMFPTLLPGDTLQIAPNECFDKGDIIVFMGKDSLIAHRVINYKEDEIISMGDSLFIADPCLKQSDILGKVIGRTRKNKFLSIEHWSFRLSKRMMPKIGRYPRLLIRYCALIYTRIIQ
nr:S26 family signal peptidase [uncultured Carboxylicivirga sp.]